MNPSGIASSSSARVPLAKVIRSSLLGQNNWSSITSNSKGDRLAICVNGGGLFISHEGGASWFQPPDPYRYWACIRSSSDGIKLVASSLGYLYTSIDSGLTWSANSPAGFRDWGPVAISSGGMSLAACVSSGYIHTSTDGGATWVERSSGPVCRWKNIKISSNGLKLIAVGYSQNDPNVKVVYVSSNGGVSWAKQLLSGEILAASADGLNLAVGSSSSSSFYTSSDGGSGWASRVFPTLGLAALTISADGKELAGCTNGGDIYRSVNGGASWSRWRVFESGSVCSMASSSNGMSLFLAVYGGYFYRIF
jgi:photosystem II stability/assembly factor-like uncharacterized protein